MPLHADEILVGEAAIILQRTPRRIRQLIANGILEACAEGEGVRKTYYLKLASVEELQKKWQNEPPQSGWRKGRKRKEVPHIG